MGMLRECAGGDEKALAEIGEWARMRERRLPVLRRLVALLGRHGVIGPETNRIDRDLVVAQCLAIVTRHGIDAMGYRYLDSQSGLLATLLDIDLHAVELNGTDPGRVFSTGPEEREFLERIRGKGHAKLGRMARDAVIPWRKRMTLA